MVSECVDSGSATGALISSCSGEFVDAVDPKLVEFLFVAAAIVAFSNVVSGGLIPHAKQGGSGVEALAVAGSKFEGTGFENEQIGQTHVAFVGGAPPEARVCLLCDGWPSVADDVLLSCPAFRF